LIVAKIRDTGIGVPEEQLEDIFDVFQQVNGSTTRKHGGSGLGLSISKKIAVLMGGDISVMSKEGEGAYSHENDRQIPLKVTNNYLFKVTLFFNLRFC